MEWKINLLTWITWKRGEVEEVLRGRCIRLAELGHAPFWVDAKGLEKVLR
jgi:hypothetical protein